MSFEDQPTQQLRRTPPPAPMPGPLDLTADEASQSDTTEVLSVDELLGPDRRPMDVVPVRSDGPGPGPAPVETLPAQSPTPARGALGQRLRNDARSAFDGARTRGWTWLQTGDNALIVLTLVVGLLLVVVIAAV
jgi:hypothetical protein